MTVSEKLRLVYGLHHHAEMFGFNWDDGSDWTWHDVACKIADEVDAENAKLRELAAILCHCMRIKASCDDCRINGHKGELARDPLCACDGLHEMLRELGIEANA